MSDTQTTGLFAELTPPPGGLDALERRWAAAERARTTRRRALAAASVLLLGALLTLPAVRRNFRSDDGENPLLGSPAPEVVAQLMSLGLLPVPQEEVTILPSRDGPVGLRREELPGDDQVVFYWLSPSPSRGDDRVTEEAQQATDPGRL